MTEKNQILQADSDLIDEVKKLSDKNLIVLLDVITNQLKIRICHPKTRIYPNQTDEFNVQGIPRKRSEELHDK